MSTDPGTDRESSSSSNHAALTPLPECSVGWYVSIRKRINGKWIHWCGGMLVNQTTVLTAAHVSGLQEVERSAKWQKHDCGGRGVGRGAELSGGLLAATRPAVHVLTIRQPRNHCYPTRAVPLSGQPRCMVTKST